MGWHKGPLPANTYHWGAVVEKGNSPNHGFNFADFRGSHAVVYYLDGTSKMLPPEEVGYYCNDIRSPIHDDPIDQKQQCSMIAGA